MQTGKRESKTTTKLNISILCVYLQFSVLTLLLNMKPSRTSLMQDIESSGRGVV